MKTQTEVQTIEATSKSWKTVILVGGMLFVGGIVTACSDPLLAHDSGRVAAIGILVYVIGKIGAWWNHG